MIKSELVDQLYILLLKLGKKKALAIVNLIMAKWQPIPLILIEQNPELGLTKINFRAHCFFG
jgi:hypothetical protein